MTDMPLHHAHFSRHWLKAQLAPYRHLAGMIFILWLARQTAHWLHQGLPSSLLGEGLVFLLPVLIFSLLLILAGRLAYLAWHEKPQSPLKALWRDASDPARLLHAAITFGLFFALMAWFADLKSAMPFFLPFSWDLTLAKADLWLHGGRYPHEWLGFLLDSPNILSFINLVYHLWFFVLWAGFSLAALQSRHSPLRSQFLHAFFAAWLIAGLITAYAFSSAGPCYFGPLALGPDPYADLMAKLKAHAASHYLPALNVQDMLLSAYQSNKIAGISAFPSLHNATSLIFTLAALRISRWIGYPMILFSLLIGVGSVILGWHYAVDVYAGWAFAIILWKLAAGRKVQLP